MDLFRLANRLRNNLKMLTDGLLVLTAETDRLNGKLAEVLTEVNR